MRKRFAALLLAAVFVFCFVPTYAEESAAATEVFVSVTDTVVAHTAMDNPIKYTLVPEAAAEHATVKVSYRAIKFLADEGTEVAVPRDIGKYLVYIEVSFDEPNRFYCADKYLVYEIAENGGAPLSETEALKSVPNEFTATIESKSATYSLPYEAPNCTLNVAGVNYRLMYSHLYANGTMSDYTEQLPTEPGDYIATCFVLDTEIGTGRLIIDKLTPEIIMDDASFTYTPAGVYPDEATVRPAGIELEYKAYKYENGAVGVGVEFPLTECGTYLISACPADTAHYGFTLSYCYITINKATPIISAESRIYTEDGKPKPLVLAVSPDYIEYDVSYYRIDDNGVTALDGAPSAVGEYYAAVGVKSSATVSSATRVFGIRIVAAESGLQRFFRIALKVLSVAVSLSAIAVGSVQLVKHNSKGGRHK